MNPETVRPAIDLGAEAAVHWSEWALIAAVAAFGLAYLTRSFTKRKGGRCGGCAGCDKSGACPAVNLDPPSAPGSTSAQ